MSIPASQPQELRAAMASYVHALHGSYLEVAETLPPVAQAQLPLVATDRFTTIAAGTANLHLIATTEPMPAPRGVEISIPAEIGPIAWDLRFYDASVVGGLAEIDEAQGPALADVRAALGIRTYLYHFTIPPGGNLSAHHAMHAGTGLAHAHAAAVSDYVSMRELAIGREALVDEMAGAERAGLPIAQALLAAQLAPNCAKVPAIGESSTIDPHALRRAVLTELRGGVE